MIGRLCIRILEFCISLKSKSWSYVEEKSIEQYEKPINSSPIQKKVVTVDGYLIYNESLTFAYRILYGDVGYHGIINNVPFELLTNAETQISNLETSLIMISCRIKELINRLTYLNSSKITFQYFPANDLNESQSEKFVRELFHIINLIKYLNYIRNNKNGVLSYTELNYLDFINIFLDSLFSYEKEIAKSKNRSLDFVENVFIKNVTGKINYNLNKKFGKNLENTIYKNFVRYFVTYKRKYCDKTSKNIQNLNLNKSSIDVDKTHQNYVDNHVYKKELWENSRNKFLEIAQKNPGTEIYFLDFKAELNEKNNIFDMKSAFIKCQNPEPLNRYNNIKLKSVKIGLNLTVRHEIILSEFINYLRKWNQTLLDPNGHNQYKAGILRYNNVNFQFHRFCYFVQICFDDLLEKLIEIINWDKRFVHLSNTTINAGYKRHPIFQISVVGIYKETATFLGFEGKKVIGIEEMKRVVEMRILDQIENAVDQKYLRDYIKEIELWDHIVSSYTMIQGEFLLSYIDPCANTISESVDDLYALIEMIKAMQTASNR